MNVDKLPFPSNSCAHENYAEGYVHEWNVNGRVIKWFCQDPDSYITIFENNIIERFDLPKEFISIDNQIRIEEDGSIDFCPVKFKRSFEKVELSILNSRLGLIWQLFDKATKETKWQNFSATFVSDCCHRETWDIFEEIKEELQKNSRYVDFFENNFVISDIILLKNRDGTNKFYPTEQLDLESFAEKSSNDACELKKTKVRNEAFKALYVNKQQGKFKSYPYFGFNYDKIFSSTSYWHKFDENITKEEVDEDPEDIFVFGGTKERISFENSEKKFAIYNTIITNRKGRLQDHEQESQLTHNEYYKDRQQPYIRPYKTSFPLFFVCTGEARRELLVSEKIKPIVDSIFPFYVIIEPKTIQCTLGESVKIQISKFRWAITLICDDNPNAYSRQHALIAIQGVYDGSLSNIINSKSDSIINIGEKFTIISHLRGQGDIEIKPIDEKKLRFAERSNIWLLSREKIRKMLNDMKDEKEKRVAKFSIVGAYSAFSGGGNNCITWALSYLKDVGIDLGWSYFGFLYTKTRSFTQKNEYYLKEYEYLDI